MSSCLTVRAGQDRSLRALYEASYRPLRHLGKSKATIAETRCQLNVFDKFFAERLASQQAASRPASIDDLSDELLADAMAWQIDRGRSVATANKLYRVLKSLWRFARKKRLLESLPELDPIPEEKREPRTWTLADYEAILTAADALVGYVGELPAALWWRALLLTVVNTGGRISAVMAIRLVDVDLARREILLRAHNQKQRCDQRFELQPTVVVALRAIGAGDPHGDTREFLFPWPLDCGNEGRQWRSLRRHYRRLLDAAGLPSGRRNLFHNLRAFTATILADAKGEEFARDYLGHSHASVTRRYLDRAQMKTKRSGVAHLPEPKLSPSLRIHAGDAG